MVIDVLFAITFGSQVLLLSVLLPWRLRAETPGSPPEWRIALRASTLYRVANHALAGLGALLLVALLATPLGEQMTPTLLTIALYFVAQMVPLVAVAGPALAKTPPPASVVSPAGGAKITEYVSSWLLATAAVLFLGYLASQLALHGLEWNPRLKKIPTYVFTQLILAGTLWWTLRSQQGASEAEGAERHLALTRMAPMFTILSIGISVYYIGKDVLFYTDLQALRPVMMSVFLQGLAVLGVRFVLLPAGPELRQH